AVSSLAFTIVKYAGALYLVYLGVQALRGTRSEPGDVAPERRSLQRTFRDGSVVAFLNPKTALFFAAFLPQFMSAGHSPPAQSMLLGSIFVAIAAVTETIYALAAGAVAPALQRARHPRCRPLPRCRGVHRPRHLHGAVGWPCKTRMMGQIHRGARY